MEGAKTGRNQQFRDPSEELIILDLYDKGRVFFVQKADLIRSEHEEEDCGRNTSGYQVGIHHRHFVGSLTKISILNNAFDDRRTNPVNVSLSSF